jgi:hypothetical protein
MQEKSVKFLDCLGLARVDQTEVAFPRVCLIPDNRVADMVKVHANLVGSASLWIRLNGTESWQVFNDTVAGLGLAWLTGSR